VDGTICLGMHVLYGFYVWETGSQSHGMRCESRVVLPQSGLKVTDRLDQTAQAVCGLQIVNHGLDYGL
jgi:hypothetical protein